MAYTPQKTTILKYIKENLSPERFNHCVNVSKLAVSIAISHKTDSSKAEIAGLLHDCAKNLSDKKQIDFFTSRPKIKYFALIAQHSPKLLHSYASAIIAKEKFSISDKDILNAIAHHTLGNENMSLLEKIIYVADSVSFERNNSDAVYIRKLAKENIDEAFVEVMRHKIEYVLKKRNWLCPKCIDVWNFYAQKI
ncbi:MAG: bis(5'-nucleosyl)-tetraphosphatase (symmetrical) YqeK [Elusimicrobiota bacterium]|jgi:predicted HD superfamily hydrolase involved in NAD metabolism|nr:bis(5'-nucleosyl)-tetraphosphatase (symmetrical) YqeK [Elusimicrobiota bacterium]